MTEIATRWWRRRWSFGRIRIEEEESNEEGNEINKLVFSFIYNGKLPWTWTEKSAVRSQS
jgi:hypothetical protein